MDQSKIEEIMENLLLSPKKVEVDGQVVENHSAADLIKLLNYYASKDALKGKRLPIRITKMAAGGGAL
ncbi:MAG: hypothetical protein II840_04130 [Kiritimatiellae bacterium]|jgi:hypothetical protein|nr:hypothetical protein [Kiritimatiellia bacterium]